MSGQRCININFESEVEGIRDRGWFFFKETTRNLRGVQIEITGAERREFDVRGLRAAKGLCERHKWQCEYSTCDREYYRLKTMEE